MMKGKDMNYSLVIKGSIVSVQKVEQKNYGDKISDAKSVISFMRVLEDGKMETLKVKAPYDYKGKAGDKVELPVSVSAVSNGSQSTLYYSLVV